MKFSKLLTTAMMSVALVASSSAFAAEETTWWSMDFNDLTIAEGGSLTNTLNTAYGTTQKGVWSTEEGDLSSLADGKLVLNTQGTDITWTPNGDKDTTAITYVDATVKFFAPLTYAAECDLIERNDEPIAYEGDSISFHATPFEIKNFKVKIK